MQGWRGVEVLEEQSRAIDGEKVVLQCGGRRSCTGCRTGCCSWENFFESAHPQ